MVTEDGATAFRHMHAVEVALLVGVPVNINWSNNMRLNLCAIGQLAAPLQSLWIGSQLLYVTLM